MTLRSLRSAWNDFFFKPQSPLPIALFRILYGCCVAATLVLLHADWLEWFGVHSWVSLSTMTTIEPGVRLNLFTVMPQNDHWIAAFFWIFLLFTVLLTVGLWTRVSTVVVFLCLTSMHQRNLYITHGGDTFLRIAGFFLVFAPAGAALSLDRYFRVRKGREDREVRPQAPWAQRMIQLELAWLYFASFWWKLKGTTWPNGTALYYVTQLHSLVRFPLPAWILHPIFMRAGSWFTLALEFCLGTLLWCRPLRYPLLVLGLLFHLALEYALNIPMFQWDILIAYVLFIESADLQRAWLVISPRALRSWLQPGAREA